MERRPPMETTKITPQILIFENKRVIARRGINDWIEAKRDGTLTLFEICGDAREAVTAFLDIPYASIRSISAAADKQDFQFLLQHRGIKQSVAMGHFDSESLVKDGVPLGCGGLIEKRKMQGVIELPDDLTERYVFENIKSHDVLAQTVQAAFAMAALSSRPVLAAAMDHRTGLIYPVLEISNAGKKTLSSVNLKNILDANIEYTNGSIPVLADADLTPGFRELIDQNRKQVVKIKKTNPNLFVSQKVQNPPTVILSTSVIPASVRYKAIFGQPNSIFTVRMPFLKEYDGVTNQQSIKIDGRRLNKAIAQIGYPIKHALTAKPNESFSDTNTLIIETPDIKLSRRIAGNILGLGYIGKWMKEGARIIVAEVQSGITTQADFA